MFVGSCSRHAPATGARHETAKIKSARVYNKYARMQKKELRGDAKDQDFSHNFRTLR